MSSRLFRLLAIAHMLPVSDDGSRAAPMAGRGVPARARRLAPVSAPAPERAHSVAPSLGASTNSQPPAADDPDDEMRCDSAVARARYRERARCAAIVTSALGLKHPDLAYVLAFRTRMSRAEALAVLELVETPSGSRWAHLRPSQQQLGVARRPKARPQTVH